MPLPELLSIVMDLHLSAGDVLEKLQKLSSELPILETTLESGVRQFIDGSSTALIMRVLIFQLNYTI